MTHRLSCVYLKKLPYMVLCFCPFVPCDVQSKSCDNQEVGDAYRRMDEHPIMPHFFKELSRPEQICASNLHMMHMLTSITTNTCHTLFFFQTSNAAIFIHQHSAVAINSSCLWSKHFPNNLPERLYTCEQHVLQASSNNKQL